MKADVLSMLAGRRPAKGPSKETLNHTMLIALVTGLDPVAEAPRAFRLAYERLGIDVVNRVPDRPAPPPAPPGTTRPVRAADHVDDYAHDYVAAHLGVYDTVSRVRFPFDTVEEFLAADPTEIDLDYAKLLTPVPHPLDRKDVARRQRLLGEAGLYYCQLYTTLFMWGVEYLGWEVFLLAGALDPEALDRLLLAPASRVSQALTAELAACESPFVFCHDDLADRRGPVFPPEWYDRYVFSRYKELFAPAKAAGKPVIFVADGNMDVFLERLLAVGVDGVMLENPATDFDLVIDAFSDRIIIGGIDTGLLHSETPEEIRDHVLEVHDRTAHLPGFIMSTPGGLHDSVPLENAIAYFDARAATGHTEKDWRPT